MPKLYRVFPYLKTSAHDDTGGALYVPQQGGGRIDNPDSYSVLYLSNAPAGAIAEAFGRFPEWTTAILEGSMNLPASTRALARYTLAETAPVCDLDQPKQLLELDLHPSDVVTREYARSRAWARRIYATRSWVGIRWWSYYDSQWFNFGLWDRSPLVLDQVSVLSLDDPEFQEASRTIVRRIIQSRGR